MEKVDTILIAFSAAAALMGPATADTITTWGFADQGGTANANFSGSGAAIGVTAGDFVVGSGYTTVAGRIHKQFWFHSSSNTPCSMSVAVECWPRFGCHPISAWEKDTPDWPTRWDPPTENHQESSFRTRPQEGGFEILAVPSGPKEKSILSGQLPNQSTSS